MSSKFFGALKCFFKCPAGTMRLMMSLEPNDPKAVESVKAHCPEVDVASVGFYAGIFLALVFLAFCMLAYVMSLLYNKGILVI
jgi:hypothetical protein